LIWGTVWMVLGDFGSDFDPIVLRYTGREVTVSHSILQPIFLQFNVYCLAGRKGFSFSHKRKPSYLNQYQ
jgi:hypothetical protein